MAGWIKLHRKLKDSPIFSDADLLKVFVWCLLKANHRPRKQMLGNEILELNSGQFPTGRNAGSEENNMKPSTFWDKIKLLEKLGAISLKSDNKKTIVTVENWGFYQNEEESSDNKSTTEQQQNNNKITSNQQQTDTNKNVKNYKNEKNIIMTPDEAEYISVLENIKNYPLDREKDLDYYKTLEKRYPTLDLVEAIKKFEVWVLDNPFKEKANHRSRINTSFSKYVEWKTCIKEVKEERPKRGPLKLIIRDGA